MAGNMYSGKGFINNMRALLEQVIYYPGDQFFIAGDGRSGDDNSISGNKLYFSVFAHRHPCQSGKGLPLAAGGNQRQPFMGIALDIIQLHQYSFWYLQISELTRNRDNINHTPS